MSAFAQSPRSNRIKVGYVPTPTGADAAAKKADFTASLDAILEADPSWYWLTHTVAMRDQAYLDGAIEWVQTQRKFFLSDSSDTSIEDPSDTLGIAARHKGTVDRTGIFYHPSDSVYCAASLCGWLASRDFDQSNSAYTAKFKQLPGIAAADMTSAVATAITGYTEGTGQATVDGHIANTLINIGGKSFVAEGSTLTPNVFIDEIHTTDYLVSRTEEAVLALYLNNARIPFDTHGMELLASAPRQVMAAAVRAGLVAQDIDPLTGAYAPAYTITVPSVYDVTAAQRAARVAPAIDVTFRYAGAVHYTTVRYSMTF